MLLPCEVAIKYFIPAVRSSVTKELSKKYNLTQVDIASKLGITQAAVSKYLAEDYSNKIKNLEKEKFIKAISESVADSIIKNKIATIKFSEDLCKCCKTFSGKVNCEISIKIK